MITDISPIVHGIRGPRFALFISDLLKLGHLKENSRKILLDTPSIRLYEQAFTNKTANPRFNYEYLEFLGDATLNKAIPWYLTRRFPKLCCPDGVKILARLKIHLISSKVFASIAKRLYFINFISSDEFTRTDKPEKLLEDVFEAFFCVTELIIDNKFGLNTGYGICYHIISSLLDTIPISLRYEDLYDAKTRLKELFDLFGSEIGIVKYNTERKEDRIHYAKVYRIMNGKWILLGEGSNNIKIEAEQIAAQKAITLLNSAGHVKGVPAFYKNIEKMYD
jgi:dsRNA-specific ribonuclease